MRSLVALDIAPGQNFLNQLSKIWDANDAVLPIDQRLPHAAKQSLIEMLGASSVVTSDGRLEKLTKGFKVESGDALVIATSGTTGAPKGVVHTHDSIKASVIAGGSRLGCSPADHWLACLPFAHVGGLSVALRARHYESKVSFIKTLDQFNFDTSINNGVNLTSLVPTLLKRLDISRFRAVLVGGSTSLLDTPSNVITTYGLTETMGGIAYNGVALDDVSIRIGLGEEIQVRGPMLFRTYRDGTNPKDEHGWFATGDLGEIVDGVLQVNGRMDDLIKTGGFKVWPKTVEGVISQIEGVAECVVAGLPDEKWGTAVCAWIVFKASHPMIGLKEIKSHVKQSLPNYCVPKKIFIVNEIPRTAIGKVKVSELLRIDAQAL